MSARTGILLGLVLVTLAAAATPALAERNYKGEGWEKPPTSDYSMAWLTTIYVLVFLAGICVVAFKNARRTHLD